MDLDRRDGLARRFPAELAGGLNADAKGGLAPHILRGLLKNLFGPRWRALFL